MATEKIPEVEAMLGDIPLTEETTCGIWFIKSAFLQKFANKKAYVFLYGLLGCIFSASYSYFSGTITTIEKRFRIPSQTMGVITVGNDISQLFISTILSYYIGKGRHRPRWIAVGVYTVVLFCALNALPHFLYGPGEESFDLTYEHGMSKNISQESQDKQRVCQASANIKCEVTPGEKAPQIILFISQLIAGVGGSLYYTLGVSYMDDNIKKSKTPVLISFSYFLKMLGPVFGYSLASICLSLYISPTLTPKINNNDPRWLGAWWIGWIILGTVMFVLASLIGLFPRSLPRAAMRRSMSQDKTKQVDELPASLHDMMLTFKRIVTNKVLVCKNIYAIFYMTGYMPYWIFMPKYLEIIYKQSASTANLITGSVGLVSSACGILASGLVITKFKPTARPLALWNVTTGVIAVVGFLSYSFLGCPMTETQGTMLSTGELNLTRSCNADCHCDYVTYTPVCAYGKSYISPCHAGCKGADFLKNGTKIYTDCACINETDDEGHPLPNFATSGPCPVDCKTNFYIFLTIVCLLKFVGASSSTSNFLVSMRCVEEKDKTVALGFSLMLFSLFSFIPAPILFGYIIDTTCLVWGKTCNGKGNCWLYNADKLRYMINYIGSSFIGTGIFFGLGAWYFAKGLKLFDEPIEKEEIKFDKIIEQQEKK
ncbi:solute carrier organic anion transporter family member 74D [Halyomorpha halys]|uniref:solute carrier organic anion transporter family member 74D n=1 Tax=Halyomorpha halys TaxID=286706 RepID=UPI0006D4D4D4|nr:solute carrier organic anion transporter family member 5A1 [Halyomorpha halys]